MSRSLRTVKSATQTPAPAESPAITIFSGFTALCGAFGGGLVRYRSETFLVSAARRNKLYVGRTCCDNIVPRIDIRQYVHHSTTGINELTMDMAKDTVGLYDS